MREYFFDIGGTVLRLLAPGDTVDLAGGNLEPFQLPPQPWQHSLELRRVRSLPSLPENPVFDDPERRVYLDGQGVVTAIGTRGDPYLHIRRQGRESLAQVKADAVPGPLRSKLLLRAMEAEHLIVNAGGLLLHASFIGCRGRAILFSAPSGTGKSTQAQLWQSLRGAELLNGDRACVLQTPAGFRVRGVPFCGSSGICQAADLPLAAVVILSQAPKTAIRPLTGARAFRGIWEGCSLHAWNAADVDRCAATAAALAQSVPIFHLACTPDASAVEALEAQL